MRLGIRSRLGLLALSFLIIPVLGYISTVEMKRFMLRHQQSSQLIAARAMAAAMHGRYGLFHLQKNKDSGEVEDAALYIHHAPGPFRIDGDGAEWGPTAGSARKFGRESLLMESGSGFDPGADGFELALARWETNIYILISVQDQAVVPLSKGRSNPEKADHLTLGLGDPEGEGAEFIIPVSPGNELSFLMKSAKEGKLVRSETLTGRMKLTNNGYVMEIAVPEKTIAGNMGIRIMVADVDDPSRGRLKSVVGPRDEGRMGHLRLAYQESPQIQSMLGNLFLSGVEARVYDRAGRLRASTSPIFPGDDLPILRILANGAPAHTEIRSGPQGEMVVVAAPIKDDGGSILGVVILERSTGAAQSMQDKAMENTLWGAMLTFLMVAAGLAIYSTRLSLRIHGLRGEAEKAIDHAGRVRVETLEASRESGDEIGDLSRSISGLLKKLRRHHDFLAILPRTLKHEINNPLNTITVSLENLGAQEVEGAGSKYIKSAGRGAARLREIVDNLAEAASVEDSIKEERFERVSLPTVVGRYMENSAGVYRDHQIRFVNLAGDCLIIGSDSRIEQLLDKLMDNAADFAPPGGLIEARLERENDRLHLTFYNDGPPIPEGMEERIFDSLVADREGEKGVKSHLGIGLYVARVIAEGHGGYISARNSAEGNGVEVCVILPVAPQG
ncbi:MAG: ATP-binding protein [Nitrospinota bacterium]|nr:ATP-binding protein [Nitrospinota bacterium]